jgi:hypothetical protein
MLRVLSSCTFSHGLGHEDQFRRLGLSGRYMFSLAIFAGVSGNEQDAAVSGPILAEERGRAQAVLQPVFESVVEGLDTADLKAAEHLLAILQ